MSKQSDKSQMFEKENQILTHSKEITQQGVPVVSPDSLLQEYDLLSQSYAQLLGEVKLLTSVSDRLQYKLNRSNDNVSKKQDDHARMAQQLESAKQERRAKNMVIFVLIIVFATSHWTVDDFLAIVFDFTGGFGLLLFKFIFCFVVFQLIGYSVKYVLEKTAYRVKESAENIPETSERMAKE